MHKCWEDTIHFKMQVFYHLNLFNNRRCCRCACKKSHTINFDMQEFNQLNQLVSRQRLFIWFENGSEPVVVWLRDWPGDRRVAGSIPETTDSLTNSSGQVTNALVSLFTKQYNWYQLANGLGVRHWAFMPRSLTQESTLWPKGCIQSWNMFRKKYKNKKNKQTIFLPESIHWNTGEGSNCTNKWIKMKRPSRRK